MGGGSSTENFLRRCSRGACQRLPVIFATWTRTGRCVDVHRACVSGRAILVFVALQVHIPVEFSSDGGGGDVVDDNGDRVLLFILRIRGNIRDYLCC